MLFAVAAELGRIAGWASCDTGRHAAAERYWIAALRAAHLARDRGIGANILKSMSLQHAAMGRCDEAVALSRAVLEGAGHSAPRVVAMVRAMADTGYTFGRLDVLVNNAAVAIDRQQQASSADMEKVRVTLDANVVGAWRCCTSAIAELKNNGYGRIVNVTTNMSTFVHLGTGSAAYRVSKTALNALTCILAGELHEANILVNAASPGKADTRLAYGKADRSPQDAADDFLWLATLPDGGPTGGLFHKRQRLDW